jgi:hypothetical protein
MHNTDLIPGDSLLTKTPDEGRQLAIAIARRVVKATQPDAATRERLREVYVGDAGLLLQVCQIVATEFATIAAANGYWRDSQH